MLRIVSGAGFAHKFGTITGPAWRVAAIANITKNVETSTAGLYTLWLFQKGKRRHVLGHTRGTDCGFAAIPAVFAGVVTFTLHLQTCLLQAVDHIALRCKDLHREGFSGCWKARILKAGNLQLDDLSTKLGNGEESISNDLAVTCNEIDAIVGRSLGRDDLKSRLIRGELWRVGNYQFCLRRDIVGQCELDGNENHACWHISVCLKSSSACDQVRLWHLHRQLL